MRYARRLGAKTVAVTSNPKAALARLANVVIVLNVGPEVIAGSTRMKAGTAQKLVLNMLSTASMVRRGRVLFNWMINLQLKNRKLRERAKAILAKAVGVSPATAAKALRESGEQLPVALLMLWKGLPRQQALSLLGEGPDTASVLRAAWAARKQAMGGSGTPAGGRQS
jgi:N-acetylmuramic acid 6-phosphate etherase